MNPLLTQNEAAKLLGIAPRTLEVWRYQRKGPPFVRLGRAIRYSSSALSAWADDQTVRPELE